jgi:putative endonuclease
MQTLAQRLGAQAEDLVAARLRATDWLILGRNVRVGRAEVDILAIDPGPPATLVAVEVRWRRSRDYGLPEETVDRAKLARLRAAVLALRDAAPLPGIPVPRVTVRVDIVAVEPAGVMRHHRAVG